MALCRQWVNSADRWWRSTVGSLPPWNGGASISAGRCALDSWARGDGATRLKPLRPWAAVLAVASTRASPSATDMGTEATARPIFAGLCSART